MANIQAEELYERMEREFATMGSGGPRFEDDFIASVNDATQRISNLANLSTRISRIDQTSDEIELSDAYMHVLVDGVAERLHIAGRRPSKGAEKLIKMRHDLFIEGCDEIRQDLLNDAVQDAIDADEHFDGPVGLSKNIDPTYED
jgi:hypothetical protein